MTTRHRDGQPESIVHQHGLTVHVDRHEGTVFGGTGPDGKPYQVVQRVPYGYLPGVKGDDGEGYDVYVGPHHDADRVFIVTQRKAATGEYDEQKAMLGFKRKRAAEECYRAHTHPNMFGGMGELTLSTFHRQLEAHRDSGAAIFRAVVDDGPTDGPESEPMSEPAPSSKDPMETSTNGRATASGGSAPGDPAREPAGDVDDAAPDGMLVRTAVVRAVRREARPSETNPQRALVVVDAVASTEDIDSHDSILLADWAEDGRLKRYQENPVLQWMHGRDPAQRPAIGNGENVRVESKELLFRAVFDDTTEFDREVAAKYEKGILRAFSVGWAAGDAELRIIDGREIIVFSKNELREISAVNVPSNPNALATKQRALVSAIRDVARERGGRVSVRDALTEIRSRAMDRAAVPFHAYPPVDDSSWDGGAAEKRVRAWATGADSKVDFAKYAEAFAWKDTAALDSLASYKLIHHDVRGGKLVTSRRGTMAAGGAMQGSRGGVKVPDMDVPGVKAHLAKHYAQFDIQPPWEAAKSAHGSGETSMKKQIQIEERAVVDERAAKGTVTCGVTCPECSADFDMSVRMSPMSPEKAQELDQTRAALGEREKELTAEQKRASSLEERLAITGGRYAALLLDSAYAALTERSGKKFEPHELDDEKELARMFLADAAPDPDSPMDDKGQPTRTMGQKKLATRLEKLDKRRDLAILDAPITTTVPLPRADEQTRAAASGQPVIQNGETRAGDGFAGFLNSPPAGTA